MAATGTPHSPDGLNLDPDVLHHLLQLNEFHGQRDFFPKEWFPGDDWVGAIRALHHIGACASLEAVTLQFGPLGRASDLRALHHGLKQQVEAPQWRTLDLSYNRWLLGSDEACEVLLAILRLCLNLEELDVFGTDLNASGLAILARGMSFTALQHHGAQEQQAAATHEWPQWRTLDLSWNDELLASVEAGEHMLDILRICTKLEELDIGGTGLEAPGLATLTRGLCSSGHPSLNTVPLVSLNKAVQKGEWADYMADLLEAPSLSITKLNTKGYDGQDGYSKTRMAHLCGVLRTKTKLHELEISGKHCILLEALYPARGRPTFNTSITRLNCDFKFRLSDHDERAVEHLAAVVAYNNAVKDLTVAVREDGVKRIRMATWRSFSQALRINTGIHHLTISIEGCTRTLDSIFVEVLDVLKVNLILRTVVLDGGHSGSAQAAIDLKLKENAAKRSEVTQGLHVSAPQPDFGLPGSKLKKSLLGTSPQHIEDDWYPNTNVDAGGRRGLAVIVNMEKDMPGGQVDTRRLEVLAKALFFETKIIIVDLNDAQKIRNDFQQIAQSSELAKDDAFLCYIHAYGEFNVDEDGRRHIDNSSEADFCSDDLWRGRFGEAKFSGIAKQKAKFSDHIIRRGRSSSIEDEFCVEDILRPFTASKHLANKPKVFLINTCGGLIERGNIFMDGRLKPLYIGRDYLVAFSTSCGDASNPHAKSGTNFVKTLIDLGTEAFSTTDVLSIMTGVIDKVAKMEVNLKYEKGEFSARFERPQVRHTLAKKRVYWRPDRLKPAEMGPERDGHRFDSMRSDVVEIGFSDFHDAFDPGQIIFLCKRDAVLSELHITFLHSNGMALLIGLGLSWSYIVLKDDSPEIHVHEQEEHTWKEWWADCNKEQSSLVVVREKDFVGKVQSGGEDLTSTKELLILDSRSPGCALQGFARSLMNTTKQCSGGDAHTQGTSHEMTGASGSGTALKQSGDLRRDFAALRISEPDGKSKFSDCGTQTDQPEGLTGNDKHLTVIVHLQSLGSNIDTLQTANGNVMDPSDKAYLEEFKINAIMTVRFFHQPADEGDQWDHVKYLEVTIQATYQLDSLLKDVTSDLDVFGWYHDNLTSSFECVDKGSSCLTDNKFVSALVTLDETIATGVGGTEGTSYAMKSGGDVSVGLPHNILKGKVHVGKERQISSSQNQSYQHSTPSQTLVLQGTGFMPLDVCRGQRLKYLTTVAIPMPEHLVWRDIGYHMAKRATMLSGMATAIWGHWDLLEMRNFHTYELCITRDLRRRRLLSLQQKTASARKQSKQSHGKIEKQDYVVQTLFRRFLVYHGFTTADYDSKNHEWEMRGGRQMPKGSAEKFLKPGANFSQRSTNAS